MSLKSQCYMFSSSQANGALNKTANNDSPHKQFKINLNRLSFFFNS